MERKLESKIRRRFDQLYDDLIEEGYDKAEIQDILDDFEDKLIEDEHVTLIDATPSTWRLLLAAGWRGRRDILALIEE